MSLNLQTINFSLFIMMKNLSLHEDSSLDGSYVDDGDEQYIEYIDNEPSQKNSLPDEKERKANTLLMAVPKRYHFRTFFMARNDAKEIGHAIKTKRVWSKASSSKHKPSHSSGSYSSYTTSSSKASTTATPGLADEVIHSFLATNADDVILYKETGIRPEWMEKCMWHLIREKSNVSIATILSILPGSASLKVQRKEAGRKQINWVEQTADEELNHALMAFTVNNELKKYRRIGMKAVKDKDALQKIVDSWFASSKNLWKLIDCGMSSTVKIGLGYGIQSNAEVLGYEEEISRGIFALRETDAGYYDIPLYSRFKQVEYKGVPHPLSPTVSDASSTVYSTCPSNDSDGELGAVSDHSVNDDPIHDHILYLLLRPQDQSIKHMEHRGITKPHPGRRIYKGNLNQHNLDKVLDFEEPAERPVNTGSTPSAQVNTGSTPSAELNTGETERVQRREGKDPMTEEDLQAEVQASKKSKELQS
ncbi:hypothetical protein Tco_1310616 [Tanacetum coccineum]